MIYIDPRAGSDNLIGLFAEGTAEMVELPAGDVAIPTPDGGLVGVEFKKIPDVLQCICTGRFAGTQLPALAETYQDWWLLIEGRYMAKSPGGQLMLSSGRGNWYHAHVGSRYFGYAEYAKWQMTMATRTGLKIATTGDRLETKAWILALHAWWQTPDSHRSHTRLDKSADSNGGGGRLVRASLRREIAERLPGIGHDKAMRAEAHFPTTFDMIMADTTEWERIEGVGQKMAERIRRKILEE